MNAQVSTLPTPLDRLAGEISDLLQQDVADIKTEAEIKAARNAMPWEVGARLAEAREMFPSDEQYGQWIVTDIIEKMSVTANSKTFTRYKNLAANFGHLRPEIETFSVTALYKLNAWAEQFKPRSSINLGMVKEQLTGATKKEKPASAPNGKSWVDAAVKGGVMSGSANATVRKTVQAELKKIDPTLDFRKVDMAALKPAIAQLHDIQNPEQVEDETEQAVAEFVETSKSKNPVKTVAQITEKLERRISAEMRIAMDEEIKRQVTEARERLSADYRKLNDEAMDLHLRAEQKERSVALQEKRANFFMNREELALVTGMLHADKYPDLTDAQRERMNKAFNIMRRIQKAFP